MIPIVSFEEILKQAPTVEEFREIYSKSKQTELDLEF